LLYIILIRTVNQIKTLKEGKIMSMIRWDPARDLMSLRQAMDRLFEESVIRPSSFTFEIGGGNIPIDMYQTDTEVIVKATLPGIKPEEVDISVNGNTLTIKAERKEETETKEKNYIHKENRYGIVTRSITLPVDVKADIAEASFDNGILTLNLPKTEKEKPKQIKVQTKPKTT
jgi:HSP20 family protein